MSSLTNCNSSARLRIRTCTFVGKRLIKDEVTSIKLDIVCNININTSFNLCRNACVICRTTRRYLNLYSWLGVVTRTFIGDSNFSYTTVYDICSSSCLCTTWIIRSTDSQCKVASISRTTVTDRKVVNQTIVICLDSTTSSCRTTNNNVVDIKCIVAIRCKC